MKSSRAEKLVSKKVFIYIGPKNVGSKKVSVKISKNLVSFKKCFVNVPDIAGRVFIGVLLYWYCALLS